MVCRTLLTACLFVSFVACSSNGNTGASNSGGAGGAAGAGGSGSGGSSELGPPVDMTNQVILRNQSGAALSDYPLQFARPFRQGEIKTFPQVWIDGRAVSTQADVKQRWPDGSVRHAILSLLIADLPADKDVTLQFGQQSDGNNKAPETAELLDAAYDFDARIALSTGGNSVEASARQMLMDGHASTWTSGPIATTLVLADHGASRVYDLGFDTYRSIRPIFEATFWPQLHQVRVRYIGENANTTTLQDVAYDLSLSMGSAQPQQVYSRKALAHYFGTRWTKVAWSKAAPENKILMDHGLSYLTRTQFLPNFDTTLKIPESVLAEQAMYWPKVDTDLYGAGTWTKYMPTTGGRQDIGPVPAWTAFWLYTGDPRAREVAFTNADLAAAWPLHYREGEEQTYFDRAQKVPGIGLPRSINAHPNLWFPNNNGVFAPILPTPRIVDANNSTFGGWVADGAHQPDPFSPQYILTGDHFYLEEMQLWAAAQALVYAPGQYGRGEPGHAGIQDQIRGNAWVLRNRANAAFLSPDGAPEKKYFNELVEDALALWEGQRNVQGTALQNHPEWKYGHDQIPATLSPLRFWSGGDPPGVDSGADPAKAGSVEPLWMDYYFLMELGRTRERGFPAGAVLEWFAPVLNAQFSAAGYDPRLCITYRTPIADTQKQYFTTWAQVQEAFLPGTITAAQNGYSPPDHYGVLAASAAALTSLQSGGDTAWMWLSTNVRAKADYTKDECAWNLVPRAKDEAPLPPPMD